MKEISILFQPWKVNRILEWDFTMTDMQTRRLRGLEYVNSYPGILQGDSALGPLGYRGPEITDYNLKPPMKAMFKKEPGLFHWFLGMSKDKREINPIPVKCPYGQAGDHLWVKETWMPFTEEGFCVGMAIYRATDDKPEPDGERPIKWRSPRYMPRWASRITLEITKIRVERLRQITNDDAQAEGVDSIGWLGNSRLRDYRTPFSKLWDTINAKRGFPWSSNPWVWVLEFIKL